MGRAFIGVSCETSDSVFSEVALVSTKSSFLLVRLNFPPLEGATVEGASSNFEAEFTLLSCLIMSQLDTYIKILNRTMYESIFQKVAPSHFHHFPSPHTTYSYSHSK